MIAEHTIGRVARIHPVWMVVCLLALACRPTEPALPFDPHIKDLNLVRLMTGDDALREINRLHGRPIDIVRGFIAHYESPHDKATIWVSEATSEDLARQQIEVMINKMKESKTSPFRHFRLLDARGTKVIAFDGMDKQVHYVFKDNKWVYWLSANTKRIDKILEHIQKTE